MIARRLAHVLRTLASRPLHALALMLCAAAAVLAATTVHGLASGVGRQLDLLIADWRNQRSIAAWGRMTRRDDGAECESNSLTDADLHALDAAFGARATFYPRVFAPALVEARGMHRQMNVRATGTAYFRMTEWFVASGDPLTDDDDAHAAKACVVGATTAEQFAATPGAILRINGVPFRVKGVLERRGRDVAGEDADDVLYVPPSASKRILCAEGLRGIGYAIADPADDRDVTNGIGALLRARHRRDDFRVVDPEELRRMYARTYRAKETLIALLTAIATTIAVAIITNVTLLSIRQRRAEIGLKRALGATRLAIVAEVAAETTLIACCGAIAGVVAFAIVANVVTRMTRFSDRMSTFPLEFSWPTLFVAAFAAIVIGGAAAVIPARAAARLDPADALRR